MSRDLKDGRWFRVESEEQHKKLKSHGTLDPKSTWTTDVQKGEYVGPGLYMVLRYSQRCPRNCCYESVYKVVPATEVADMAKEEIIKLAEILKKARAG